MSHKELQNVTINDLAIMVAKGFAGMDEKFSGKFAQIDKRFDQVDKRFEQVDIRFEAVEERLDGIDAKLGGINRRIDDLALNRATRDEVSILSARVDRVEHKLGFKKT